MPAAGPRPRRAAPWPTTSSATPRCGSCTTTSTTWPAAPASTATGARRGTPTGTVNEAFAAAVADDRPARRHRAGAGLPPRPSWRRPLARDPARPAPRPLRPHPVRRRRTGSAVLPDALPQRAADGPGRQPRLRLPHRALGPSLRRLLRPAFGVGRRPTFVSAARSRRRRHLAAVADSDALRRRAGAGSTRARLAASSCGARRPHRAVEEHRPRGFHAYDDLLERYPDAGGARSCSVRSSTRPGRAWPSTSPTARRCETGSSTEINERWGTAELDADPVRPVATTSPGRSPRCAATTCCW